MTVSVCFSLNGITALQKIKLFLNENTLVSLCVWLFLIPTKIKDSLTLPSSFFFHEVLGFKIRPYSLSHSTSHQLFLGVEFFKIGSHELFAWAGLAP
jgi:hypothetical protein